MHVDRDMKNGIKLGEAWICNIQISGMKNLLELARIITRRKVRKIEIFDSATLKQKSSKFNEFYEALTSGKFKNDRDAAKMLYGGTPTEDKYRQLKSRFRKRLLNTLFFLDINQPSASSYERAYFTANKEWAQIRILLQYDARFSAAQMARRLLTVALKYEFADVVVNCTRILRELAAHESNAKDFEEYDGLLRKFAAIFQAELDAEAHCQRIRLDYFRPDYRAPEYQQLIQQSCNALVALSEQHQSPIIFFNMFMAWALRFELEHSFVSVIEVCERAEDYYKKNSRFFQASKQNAILFRKMSALLHLKDFSKGKTTAERAFKTLEAGSDLWFDFLERYFLLAMHSGHYIQALAIHREAVEHARFKKLPLEVRERWNIFEAWLGYIVEVYGQEQPVLVAQQRKQFRVRRFLEDPVLYPRHQRMFTIQKVIVQMLFFLERNQHNQAATCVDRLRSYARRQLKKDEYVRVVSFIRLLQQLARADFEPRRVNGAEKYLARLKENPFFYRGLDYELEVIPYDQLWEMLLERLSR